MMNKWRLINKWCLINYFEMFVRCCNWDVLRCLWDVVILRWLRCCCSEMFMRCCCSEMFMRCCVFRWLRCWYYIHEESHTLHFWDGAYARWDGLDWQILRWRLCLVDASINWQIFEMGVLLQWYHMHLHSIESHYLIA